MPDFKNWGPKALIIGASNGIGLAIAERLAAQGLSLILVSRSQSALDQARASLADRFSVDIAAFACDMTAPGAAEKVISAVGGEEIGMVAYIAGSVRPIGFFDQDASEALATAQLNAIAPLQLFHHFGAGMRARKRGALVLTSSMAGLAGGANFTAYGAAKAFGQIMMEGLWSELSPHGVDVLSLIVSATNTVAAGKFGMDFAKLDKRFLMEPEEVAEILLDRLPHGPTAWAGELNFEGADAFCTKDRRKAAQRMTSRLNRLLTLPG